eukprot:1156951-Pelagomonas_calceolata.AAC.8
MKAGCWPCNTKSWSSVLFLNSAVWKTGTILAAAKKQQLLQERKKKRRREGREEEKKKYMGSKDTPFINKGKGGMLALRAVNLLPTREKEEDTRDQKGWRVPWPSWQAPLARLCGRPTWTGSWRYVDKGLGGKQLHCWHLLLSVLSAQACISRLLQLYRRWWCHAIGRPCIRVRMMLWYATFAAPCPCGCLTGSSIGQPQLFSKPASTQTSQLPCLLCLCQEFERWEAAEVRSAQHLVKQQKGVPQQGAKVRGVCSRKLRGVRSRRARGGMCSRGACNGWA